MKQVIVKRGQPRVPEIYSDQVDYGSGITAYFAGKGAGPALLGCYTSFGESRAGFFYLYKARTPNNAKFDASRKQQAVENALRASRDVFHFDTWKEFIRWANRCSA